MYLDLLTHDVGNFVNPINAYLELVIGTTSLTAVQHKYMSSALEATRSVSHLIRNVSRSAQMLEDQQSELVPRDLLKTLLQVSTDARSAFLSRRVNIKLNFPKADVWVMADGLLDEVFYNLLSNSIKYDDHDEVTIDVDVEVLQENEKNIARVKVIDRGTGIPDDLKEKVFSRGFRQMAKADRPSLHKSKGAGMGLSLVKSLVNKYEGKIWVENRVYADHSMGSVFIVLLPVP
jgi:signal transduction histidine kinase